MRLKYYFILIFTSTLISCGNDFETVDLNHFNIQSESVPDQTLVKALSFSGTPDINQQVDYYSHMIIVSQVNKDTINLLTISALGIISDDDQVMHYISEKSPIYPDLLTSFEKTPDRLSKVIFNKNFRENIDNSYPTVIGILGDITN